MLHIYSPAERVYSTPLSIPTDARGPGLAAVVQEAHICQAISIIHTAASLEDLCKDKMCSVTQRTAGVTVQKYYKTGYKVKLGGTDLMNGK